jgi:hypothetical protein
MICTFPRWQLLPLVQVAFHLADRPLHFAIVIRDGFSTLVKIHWDISCTLVLWQAFSTNPLLKNWTTQEASYLSPQQEIRSCGNTTATLGNVNKCAVCSPEFSSCGALVSSRVNCRYIAVYQNKPIAAIQCVFPQLASLLNWSFSSGFFPVGLPEDQSVHDISC